MVKLIVIGTSGHAKVIVDLIREENRLVIAGLIDTLQTDRTGDEFYASVFLKVTII